MAENWEGSCTNVEKYVELAWMQVSFLGYGGNALACVNAHEDCSFRGLGREVMEDVEERIVMELIEW